MAENEPTKLKVVSEQQPKPESNPGSVFDDLMALRKASKLVVQRKSVLVNVDVDKPPNNVYFRCHRTLLLDDQTITRAKGGTDRAIYYVPPHMRTHPKLAARLHWVTLVLTSVWPSGNELIWPVPMLVREFAPWKSARKAFELAQDQWVQMVWPEGGNDYQIETAEGIDHEPVWPERTFEELLKLGFDGKILDNEEHPYVRQLRGLLD